MDLGMDGFGDLVQQAEQLTAEVDSGGELPRVERNLHQIMEAAQRMSQRAPPIAQDSTDVKAQVVYSGFPQHLEDLENLGT